MDFFAQKRFLVNGGTSRYTRTMKPVKTFLYVCCVALFAGCATGPVDIPDDMPPAKIIQKAQEASDLNKYKTALQYYRTLGERYGSLAEYLCTSEYEIAFIHYKQKKYFEARKGFESLLERYDDVDAELLPPHFKILSEKVLTKITELGY